MALWTVLVTLLLMYVHSRLIFVEPPFIKASEIHYYNYALADPQTDVSLANVYSVDFWILKTDFLLVPFAFYVFVSLLLSLLCAVRSLESFGFTSVVSLFVILEVAKAGYFSLYYFNVSDTYSCSAYPFCVNRDPTQDPSSADMVFVVEYFGTIAIAILTLPLLFLPTIYKSAEIDTLRIGARFSMSNSRADRDSLYADYEEFDNATRGRRSPPPAPRAIKNSSSNAKASGSKRRKHIDVALPLPDTPSDNVGGLESLLGSKSVFDGLAGI